MLGYDKTTTLEFNFKRNCGLWLMLIGAVIIVSLVFGGKLFMNPFIFLVGYYVCFYIANINRSVRAKLSQGVCSKFQIRIIYLSIAVLFILMLCIAGPFVPSLDWRMIWLGVMLATGIHFALFYFVHGRTMLILSALCTLIAIGGFIFSDVSYMYFGFADGLIKLLFGIYLLFLSKPLTSRD